MSEDVGLKWVQAVDNQCAIVVLGESVAPELCNIRTENSYALLVNPLGSRLRMPS